jgi:Fe-Mn family superoxide dismutase
MGFKLPALPYGVDGVDALKPHISSEALEYHHGKHHKAYVDKLNELIANTKLADVSLDEILKTVEPGPLFNKRGATL